MTVSDEAVLLLRPTLALNPGLIEGIIRATPGAFRHPLNPDRWVLPSSAALADSIRERMSRDEPTFTTQVRYGGREVEVIPGETWLDAGRARSFVSALLALGPFELEVGKRVVGEVRTLADVYGDSPWTDPDLSSDPTESPPRTGSLVTLYRIRDPRESLSIHNSGIISYELGDSEKTYRRVAPELQAVLSDAISRLPFVEEDGAGPNGSYVDPVYVRIETPTGDGFDAKLDATRPSAEAKPFLALVDGWVRSLRQQRTGVPAGLLEIR